MAENFPNEGQTPSRVENTLGNTIFQLQKIIDKEKISKKDEEGKNASHLYRSKNKNYICILFRNYATEKRMVENT